MKNKENQSNNMLILLSKINKEKKIYKKKETKFINDKDNLKKKLQQNKISKRHYIIKNEKEKINYTKTKKKIQNSYHKENKIPKLNGVVQNNNKLNKKEVDILKNKIISIENNLNLKSNKNKKIEGEKIKSLINEKNKETISTYMNTISSEKNTLSSKKVNKNKIINLKEKYDYLRKNKKKEKQNKELNKQKHNKIINNETIDTKKREKISDAKLTVFTPIPLMKKNKGEQIDPNSKEIQNAIMLRRQEYNDYIKSLNKPKPKKIKPTLKSKRKKNFFDESKVNIIQRMYKGFSTRIINQTLNRLKVNSCAIELFCLILSRNFTLARKRISFLLLKLYYLDPFNKIDNEVDFNDRLSIKLSNKYYTFEELIIDKK